MCCSTPSRRRNSYRSKRWRPSPRFSPATAPHRSLARCCPSKAAGPRSDAIDLEKEFDMARPRTKTSARGNGDATVGRPALPGQVVLVLQGGGALGAYQVGVYQALHEAGIEPDWVIGTSVGAINGALIAGNAPQNRLDRLRQFWARVEQKPGFDLMRFFTGLTNAGANFDTVIKGIPCFFTPNPLAW